MEEVKRSSEYQKSEIIQLHNATMEFTKNSLELKKIYISLYPAVITLSYVFMSVYSDKSWRLSLFIFTIILTIGVWLLDSYYYYFQRKLRNTMDTIKNDLYSENLKPTSFSIKEALFNLSQIIYIYFVIISLAAYILSGVL